LRTSDTLSPIAGGVSRPHSRRLLRLPLLRLLTGFVLCLHAGPALAASPLVPAAWRTLEFGASNWLHDVSLSARWSPVAAEERDATLIDIGDGAPLEPGSRDIARLVATVEASTRWSSRPKRWSGEVWFLPDGDIPLQRVRSKLGRKPTRKLYRYAAEGVYRVREEGGERRSSFYAFPQPPDRCDSVSDPALLLLLASAADLAPGSTRRICVFNKKGIYEVELRSTAAPTALVEFRRRGASGSWETHSADGAVRIEIDPQPARGAGELEAFEFFELRPPLAISVDPRTRLPIAIEGSIQGFGAVRFELRSADASP
jgi:hypothetical protein